MRDIILENKARCLKCGDVIESMYCHDYVECKCGEIAVDGGRVYLKRTFSRHGYEDLSLVLHEWEESDFNSEPDDSCSEPDAENTPSEHDPDDAWTSTKTESRMLTHQARQTAR